jgi:hypothetical protein
VDLIRPVLLLEAPLWAVVGSEQCPCLNLSKVEERSNRKSLGGGYSNFVANRSARSAQSLQSPQQSVLHNNYIGVPNLLGDAPMIEAFDGRPYQLRGEPTVRDTGIDCQACDPRVSGSLRN